MAVLRFYSGTIEIRHVTGPTNLPKKCVWDARSDCFRTEAYTYAELVRTLRAKQISYVDEAKDYEKLELRSRIERTPHPYQHQALNSWEKALGRGVVVLPTGSGKTHLAVMAIQKKNRSTLVVAPTLELVRQWHRLLSLHFGEQVGIVGGGTHELCPLTVTTYDSAHLHMGHIGNKFGFIIFDECHHLPSPTYAFAAEAAIAPFRLGLTATPERSDGLHARYQNLIGPEVYRKDITELSGDFLSGYETTRVFFELSDEERASYNNCREVYKEFLERHRLSMSQPSGFKRFILLSSLSKEGKKAMEAFRRSRHIAFGAKAKFGFIEAMLMEHVHDRTLLFTQDNHTAYRIAMTFLIPIITHQTKIKERIAILSGLVSGRYSAIVTSKVLNEGVDVPEANVAVVISGNASIREHVQRLGRILRKQENKFARLYELVTKDTIETYTSSKRREHSAYR